MSSGETVRRGGATNGRQHRVSLISLGCPRTLVDSEVYLGRLRQAGYQVVDDVEDADVAIINTCSFIQEAIQESVDTVLQAVALKQQGRLKAVIAAGCLVQRFKEGVIKELPDVDGFVGVDGFAGIETVVERALRGERPRWLRARPQMFDWQAPLRREPLTLRHYAYLKVSEGCLKGCAFCIIPKIKGPLVSRPIDDLVEEATHLVQERGARELIVVGQDTSDYGMDRYGRPRIAELLAALAKVDGVRWIRLLYCHPRGITDDLIQTIRDEPRLCKYLDTAIEHADDEVLRRMNRQMTQGRLRETIARLRAQVPALALRTSVIVGFPGETDAAFETLLTFLREVPFERLGAFRFSREEGTAAFAAPDQVLAAVVQERYDRLMALQRDIATAVNARTVGTTQEVVIDEADPDDARQFVGRSAADCPEVDGIVYVQSDQPIAPGTWVPVQITDSYEYDLVGRVVGPADQARSWAV